MKKKLELKWVDIGKLVWFPNSLHKRHGLGYDMIETSAEKVQCKKDREYMCMGIGDIRYRLLMLTVSC